jgi:hypothetical protein
VRRCAERWADGRFALEQETNAYAVLPETQWRGTGRHRSRQRPQWDVGKADADAAVRGSAGERSGGQGAGTAYARRNSAPVAG